MKKLDRIMAVIMSLTGAYFLGFVIWQTFDQHAHPERYVAQSMPWYLSLEINALITAGVIALEMVLYIVIRGILKNRKK